MCICSSRGLNHLAQAMVNNNLVARELALVLKTHWEIKHSLLWMLLAAIPLHTGSSKHRGRQRTLGDGIIHLSGTRGLMPADSNCPRQNLRLGSQSSGWLRSHLAAFEALARLLGHHLPHAGLSRLGPPQACLGMQTGTSRANGDAHVAEGLCQLQYFPS